MTYTINEALVNLFEDKLNTFVKKFNKLGESVLVYSKSEPYKSGKELVVDVEVEGAYQIKDYVFIATLEWVDEKQCNLIKKISSEAVVPEMYRTRTECDHCKVKRVRKHTVLLMNINTHEYVQVGKSCVKDYLGVDIADYARYLSIWDSIDEYLEKINHDNSRRFRMSWDVEDILGQTLEQVARHGYISKNASYEKECDSTSSMVWMAMNHSTDRDGKLYYEEYEVTDASKETAKAVVEFINNFDDTDNDYAFNLKTLVNLTHVEVNNFGLVVSAIGFYLREMHKNDERKAKAGQPASNYIGNVGDKVQFTAVPTCVFSAEGEYGWSYIYKFMVSNDEVIWKTNKALQDVELTIKATVKETSEYRGTKQTVITRGRLV